MLLRCDERRPDLLTPGIRRAPEHPGALTSRAGRHGRGPSDAVGVPRVLMDPECDRNAAWGVGAACDLDPRIPGEPASRGCAALCGLMAAACGAGSCGLPARPRPFRMAVGGRVQRRWHGVDAIGVIGKSRAPELPLPAWRRSHRARRGQCHASRHGVRKAASHVGDAGSRCRPGYRLQNPALVFPRREALDPSRSG